MAGLDPAIQLSSLTSVWMAWLAGRP